MNTPNRTLGFIGIVDQLRETFRQFLIIASLATIPATHWKMRD